MTIYERRNEIEISGISDFDLTKTFECGQCFRWSKDETGAYTGIAYGHAAKLRQVDGRIIISCLNNEFETVWRRYFDLDRDYALIRQKLGIDGFMERAAAYGAGIRILRQDKWEALCSFIISQNNNIPRIKSIIDKLCRDFGDVLIFEEKPLYTFPSAEKLAAAGVDKLASLRCGYRAEYIIEAAKIVAGKKIDLDSLSGNSPDDVRTTLKTLHGVGNKVADCVMLFGFHMLDVFPLDVWMKRAVALNYGPGFDPKIFSPYAGIAQQYIFYYMRNSNPLNHALSSKDFLLT